MDRTPLNGGPIVTTIASPEYIEKLQADRAALLKACKELVRGIDDWNACVIQIIDCSKVPKWQGLGDARAAIEKAEGDVPQ
jgi:hypothetical protein